MTASRLVGRDHPRTVLRAELDRTVHSHGGLVLVAGEAGIGKTSLVIEAAREAGAQGALVLNAATWDREGAPDYWPWVQVVRGLRRTSTPDEWRAVESVAGRGLAYLLGEAGDAPDSAEAAGDATFRVQDTVTSALVMISQHRPLVVVLDDLHWADPASVRLLEFVARHTWFERLLLIGTYRDVEVDSAEHPLRETFPPLLTKATTITLTGLDVEQVREVVARTVGEMPSEDTAAAVHRRTGGNPFFVEQAVRLWHSGGSTEAITPGIRETLDARLAHLPAEVVDLLSTAAILGREFDREALAAAAGTGTTELDGLLGRAASARLVTTVDPGCYAFVHDLVREALHARMDRVEARRRHAAVVRGMRRAKVYPGTFGPGDLAHHAYLAVPEIAPEDAREYLLAAATDACGRLAPEELTGHYERALELVPDDDPALYARIALELGSAQHCAGLLTQARATFDEVVLVARELDDPRPLARAALGRHGLGLAEPDTDGRREIDLLDEALARLAEHDLAKDDPLIVRTLAAAGRTRAHATPGDRQATDLSARAVDLARTCGDDEAVGFSLLARHDTIWKPGTAPERVALAEEMITVGLRNHDIELEMHGTLLRMVALLEQGDPRALDAHSSFVTIAERSQLPRFRFLARSRTGAIATLQGRFDEAREAIDSAFAIGEHLEEADRFRLWQEQRWALSLMEGDFDTADRVIEKYRGDGSEYALIPEVVTAAQRGDAESVRHRLPGMIALRDEYPGMFTPVVLRAQAQVAAGTADAELCEQARASIAPYRDLWAVVAGGGTCYGPYSFWLAQLDAAEMRWDEAIEGFTTARDAADALDARPWSIDARLHLARALLGRGAPGDAAAAAELLSEVDRAATEIGMRDTAERARSVTAAPAESDGIAAAPESPGAAEGPPATGTPGAERSRDEFRHDGRVWNLTFAGRTVHLPDAKGLRDLHALLSRPGTEIPAIELVKPDGGDTMRAERVLGADPVLDERAKAEYQLRLTELGEEIDRALDRHDDTRAAALDQERQALLDEMRTASGLAGRARKLGDSGERARKTVTARIRDSLRRLDEHHPQLAEHLRATVSTGVTCRYQPSRAMSWSL
ncbi:AAA ATPase domain-containing protein [Haloechinothrix alba]|uniref:AAA ATPase domain-containing protein n=1 Tax=Haloechinothrix alba TaxID=664784 RepID=A0A238XYG7_9PSEU|nr:AAA family ATPase [Haloechinothrix alba]SNR63463.1 AAA ATPase domain-containing protein [Haloechinothrix alba]